METEKIVLELLYGLLDEKTAEEVRRLIATDSNAARVYDEMRKIFEAANRATRFNDSRTLQDYEDCKNVAVDPRPYEKQVNFSYDAAVDFFEGSVFQTQNVSVDNERKLKQKSGAERSEIDKRRIKKSKKQNRTKRTKGRELNSLKSRCEVVHSFFLGLLLVVRGVLLSLLGLYSKTSLFKKMILTLMLLGIVVSSAIVWKENRLRQFFKEDVRIQIIAPKTLVRGASQSITVITTDINGDPLRSNVRFRFSNYDTNEFTFAHTESGNVSGVINFDLPNIQDFPQRVKLSIFMGTSETECFSTLLSVVDSKFLHNNESDRDTKNSLSKNNETRLFIDKVGLELIENGLKQNSTNEGKGSQEVLERTGGVSIKVFPNMGRIVCDRSNHIAVLAFDSLGQPISQQFVLRQQGDKEVVANFETDDFGFASFDFVPIQNNRYYITLKHEEFNGSNEIGLSDEDDESDKPSCICYEELPPSVRDDIVVDVACKLLLGNEVRLNVFSRSKTSFLTLVEKDKAIVTQNLSRLSVGDNTLNVSLPKNVNGLLKIVIYQKDGLILNYVGESYVYRIPNSGIGDSCMDFKVTSNSKSVFGCGGNCSNPEEFIAAFSIDVKRVVSSDIIKNVPTFGIDETPLTLSVYLAENPRDVVKKLTIDDVLKQLPKDWQEKVLQVIVEQNNNFPVFFDNWLNVKNSTLNRLDNFKVRETKTISIITRAGVVGCCVLAILSFFFVIFKTIPFWRGIVVVSMAAALSVGFCLEQKALNYSSFLTSSIDNTEFTEIEGDSELVKVIDKREPPFSKIEEDSGLSLGKDYATSDETKVVGVTRKIGLGKTTLLLKELFDGSDLNGIVLLKIDDGTDASWKIERLPCSKK